MKKIVREPKLNGPGATWYWSDQGPLGTGPTRRRLTCEKVRATAEMKQGQSKRDRARQRKRKTKGHCIKRKTKEKESERLRKKGCMYTGGA